MFGIISPITILTLPANIPGWKVLTGTNTLAYYAPLKVTKKKSFITLAAVEPFGRSQADSAT
jgi:hypothetical protein